MKNSTLCLLMIGLCVLAIIAVLTAPTKDEFAQLIAVIFFSICAAFFGIALRTPKLKTA